MVGGEPPPPQPPHPRGSPPVPVYPTTTQQLCFSSEAAVFIYNAVLMPLPQVNPVVLSQGSPS